MKRQPLDTANALYRFIEPGSLKTAIADTRSRKPNVRIPPDAIVKGAELQAAGVSYTAIVKQLGLSCNPNALTGAILRYRKRMMETPQESEP